MNKILIVFFACSLWNSPLTSEEISSAEIYANEANNSINSSEQYTAQIEILSSIPSTNNTSNTYSHRIKEIDKVARKIILEDSSALDIGWWYKYEISQWEAGDHLSIIYDRIWYNIGINGVGLENLDKGSVAWASIASFPDPSSSDFVISARPNKSYPKFADQYYITLKSGYMFAVPSHFFSGNDYNIPVYVQKDNLNDLHSIGNLSNERRLSAQLLKGGNPDWRSDF